MQCREHGCRRAPTRCLIVVVRSLDSRYSTELSCYYCDMHQFAPIEGSYVSRIITLR